MRMQFTSLVLRPSFAAALLASAIGSVTPNPVRAPMRRKSRRETPSQVRDQLGKRLSMAWVSDRRAGGWEGDPTREYKYTTNGGGGQSDLRRDAQGSAGGEVTFFQPHGHAQIERQPQRHFRQDLAERQWLRPHFDARALADRDGAICHGVQAGRRTTCRPATLDFQN